jgi:hypothetical protein
MTRVPAMALATVLATAAMASCDRRADREQSALDAAADRYLRENLTHGATALRWTWVRCEDWSGVQVAIPEAYWLRVEPRILTYPVWIAHGVVPDASGGVVWMLLDADQRTVAWVAAEK